MKRQFIDCFLFSFTDDINELMKIIFSDHASSQRKERKIPKKYILETIKNPENNLKSFKNRRLLQRKFGGKILEVVIVKEGDILTIITIYWLGEDL